MPRLGPWSLSASPADGRGVMAGSAISEWYQEGEGVSDNRNQELLNQEMLTADNRTSFYSNPSYRTDARQQAVHTLVVLTGWPPFEGKRNGQTSREVSGNRWRHKADSGPTCVTGEAGHYSRSLASKAGNHSRHLLLVRKTTHQDADQDADQDQGVAQEIVEEVECCEGAVEVAAMRRCPLS